MVAAVGTYLWLHEMVPSGQVWASPPPEGEVEPDANNTVPMYVTNGSYAPLAWSQPGLIPASPRLNTPESDARPPALHLLSNTMPRLDRVLVPTLTLTLTLTSTLTRALTHPNPGPLPHP